MTVCDRCGIGNDVRSCEVLMRDNERQNMINPGTYVIIDLCESCRKLVWVEVRDAVKKSRKAKVVVN